jgi:hypothetical protein
MPCCNWSTDRSMSLIVRILREIISRFNFRSSLYDSQLVLMGFLKVTCFAVMFPVWKYMHLWSDKGGSLDTSQLLTRFPILFVPSVKSMTSFLLQTTRVDSLPWLRIFRFELTRNSMRRSPLGLLPVLPQNLWCAGQWWFAFSCYGSSQWCPSLPCLVMVHLNHMKVGWRINLLLISSAICICYPLRCWSLEENSSKSKALIWFLT